MRHKGVVDDLKRLRKKKRDERQLGSMSFRRLNIKAERERIEEKESLAMKKLVKQTRLG